VWRSLSITSSTRMMHLLRSFSQPAFLLSDEGHPRLLFYVLETINAVLTFGYTANVNLVYSLVLARQLVAALEAFELRKGVEEVWKKRRAVGTDTRDWFQNAPRLEKPPLPRAEDSATSPEGGDEATGPSAVEKGKMRRISTSSLEAETASAWEGELSKYPLSVVEEAAARYIGKNGFSPTAAWVESWHAGLPLSTLRVVIDRLVPDVERIAAGGGVRTGTAEITGGDVDARVLAFLREQQMAEYLPPPEGGIHARGWQWTDHATVWLRSYLWGTIYVAALLPFGLWSDTDVRLFRIHGRDEAGQPAPTQAAAQPQTPTTPSADTQSTTHT
jgi:hypothetical protein